MTYPGDLTKDIQLDFTAPDPGFTTQAYIIWCGDENEPASPEHPAHPAQPAGTYRVDYRSGLPSCDTGFSPNSLAFPDVAEGQYSGWGDVVFSNLGDYPLTNITVTSLNGPFQVDPATATLTNMAIGHNRTFRVRFHPVAGTPTPSFGNIRVRYTCNGAVHDALLAVSGTVHQSAAKLVLLTNDIDYHEVEVGYSFRQAIAIANYGDLPLNVTITKLNPADVQWGNFSATTGASTIPAATLLVPQQVRYFEMTFTPTTTGPHEVQVHVASSNDSTFSPQNVRLHGIGGDPVLLSTMMVMDRSGSMGGSAGTVSKTIALRNAGLLYAELLRDNWDWLGITRYNTASSTLIHLADVAGNRAAAQNLLRNDPTGALTPSGATSIGIGMQTAAQDYPLRPATHVHSQSMIVFTDGKENTAPWIAGVLPGILSQNLNLKIFCVGIGNPIETGPWGNEGIDTAAMEAMSEPTGGICRVFQSLTGENQYGLEAFYFKSFAIATGRQLALDPMYFIPVSPSIQQVASVNVVNCDRSADFLVISELFKTKSMEFQIFLQSPTGQVMEAGAAIGGIPAHVKTWGNCKLIRVKFPPRDQGAEYCGNWKLFLKPLPIGAFGASLTHMDAVAGGGKTIPVAFMVSVGSDYRLEASVTAGEVLVGQPLQLNAKTTEAWWPIPGAKVTVTVTRPNGVKVIKDLFDDGAHGDGGNNDASFGVQFADTALRGNYDFLFRSVGRTERGEEVTREVYLSKYVGPRTPEITRSCIPCWLLRWIVIVIILLLLFILFILIRCCYRKRMAG